MSVSVRKTDRIQRELRGELPIGQGRRPRAAPGPGWVNTKQAAAILRSHQHTIHTTAAALKEHVTWQYNSTNAVTSARGCGLLFWQADIERIAAIKRRCHVSLAVAVRVFGVVKTGAL
jgi:hypothetical protein